MFQFLYQVGQGLITYASWCSQLLESDDHEKIAEERLKKPSVRFKSP